MNDIIKNGRKMLKPDWDKFKRDIDKVDGNRGVKPLPIEKPFDINKKFIDLIPFGKTSCGNKTLNKVITDRHSTREYSKQYLSLDELSYLLWTTQGFKEYDEEWGAVQTVIPSAGMIHCLETYLYISRVEGIEEGIYRYLPIEQKLIEVNMESNLKSELNDAMENQVHDAAVIFIWTAFPYKMEYGYATVAHKLIAIEAGHACQNLYLAAENIGCGCCAVAAYNQGKIDRITDVDGENEFVIYTATIGKYL